MNDDPFDAVPTVDNVGGFDRDKVADTMVDIHVDVLAAVESTICHTLIDQAGDELFVDDTHPSAIRDALWQLNDAGFGVNDDTAVYAGTGAVDGLRAAAVSERPTHPTIDDHDAPLTIDGVDVFEADQAPEHVAIVVDPDALVRVPSERTPRRAGQDDGMTVSSPIMVENPDGVVVVNFAE